MPLQYQDQVSLLRDILKNHQIDCCGSVSEYEQLERLIKSLMVNSDMNQEAKPILEQIYLYSQGGINSSSSWTITLNPIKLSLSQWVNKMNSFS